MLHNSHKVNGPLGCSDGDFEGVLPYTRVATILVMNLNIFYCFGI